MGLLATMVRLWILAAVLVVVGASSPRTDPDTTVSALESSSVLGEIAGRRASGALAATHSFYVSAGSNRAGNDESHLLGSAQKNSQSSLQGFTGNCHGKHKPGGKQTFSSPLVADKWNFWYDIDKPGHQYTVQTRLWKKKEKGSRRRGDVTVRYKFKAGQTCANGANDMRDEWPHHVKCRTKKLAAELVHQKMCCHRCPNRGTFLKDMGVSTKTSPNTVKFGEGVCKYKHRRRSDCRRRTRI